MSGEAQTDSNESGWHLDKKVPLSLITAMIMQTAALIGAYYKVVNDVELLKADVQVLHNRDNKTESDLRESIAILRDQYTRMDGKLDRLIERSHE